MVSKAFELASLANGLDLDSTGEVISINMDTDVVSEGATNLYYTNERVDDRVSALVIGGLNITVTYDDIAGTLTFDSSSGVSGYDLGANNTDDLAEGTTNLYFTATRADARIAAASIGDLSDVDLTTPPANNQTLVWDSVNSIFIPGDSFSQADFDSAFTAKDTDDLSEGATNLYYTNSRVDTFLGSGSATNLILSGDLTVNGTTTYINTNTLNIGDNIITLNADETGAATQSAGIEVERGTDTNKSLLWDETADKWTVGSDTFVAATFEGNLTGNVTGTVSTLSNFTTDDLAEGANLYYTNARADARIAAASIDDLSDVNLTTPPTSNQTLVWDAVNSEFVAGDSFSQGDFDTAFAAKSIGDLSDVDLTTPPTADQTIIWDAVNSKFVPGDSFSQADFDTAFAAKDTDDLTEGPTNLYYTDERVDDRVNQLLVAGTNITLTYDDALNTLTITALEDDLTNNSVGDLADVDITTVTPTEAQVLVWDSANTKFVPGSISDIDGQIQTADIADGAVTNSKLSPTNVFSDEFVADGTTATFTLSADAGSSDAVQVFVDGVPQRASTYTLIGTTLTLGGTPINGQVIEVRAYGTALPVGTVADNSITGLKIQDGTIDLNKIKPSNYYTASTFTGDGTTTNFTLSVDPGSPWAITVYVAGVWQKPTVNYTTISTTLSFTSAPAIGEEIYVRYYGVALAVGTVADDSITGVKLQDGSITADKIAASTYVTQSFTGDGSTAVFTLSTDPGAQQALLVLVDNVVQVPGVNYTTVGTTLTFAGAPDLSADIFVRFLGLPHPVSVVADNSVTNSKLNLVYTNNQYTGDGTTTDFTIASGHTVNSVLVVLDGLIQPPTDYTVSGTTLSFAVAPLNSQSIDIRYMPV